MGGFVIQGGVRAGSVRSGRLHAILATVTLLLALSACGQVGAHRVKSPIAQAPMIHAGRGEFTFDGYAPLSEHPVRVYYDAPPNPASAQILIVMHGVRRNAADYRA